MANVLSTTRYVRPGVYIGRIIRQAPLAQGFVRTPAYVAKGNRLQTLYDVPIRRSFRFEIQLAVSATAPHLAPLTEAAVDDQTGGTKLRKTNGEIIPATKWKFIESTPGSGTFDQVLLLPEAFEPTATYLLDYQSTSRTLDDDLTKTAINELRVISLVGDTESEDLYQEGEDFRILTTVTAPAAGADNAYQTTGFSAVSQIAGAGTGTVAVQTGANYTHNYSRMYTLRVSQVLAGTLTFEWESVQYSGGLSSLPNVPLTQNAVNTALPTITATVGSSTDVALSDSLLGGTSLGVSVTIDDTSSTIAVGDTFRFLALGPGLMELDSTFSNTNQFSEIGTPVPDAGNTGDMSVTVTDDADFTGTANRSYVLVCLSSSGVVGSRTATFGWQGFGELPVTDGFFTVDEASGTNFDVTLETGITLNFNFTATNAAAGDTFSIAALAPRDQPFAKDNRSYNVDITQAGAGTLQLFYGGSTLEAGFNVISIVSPVTTSTWASAVSYDTPTAGSYTIPGDFKLHARNIGSNASASENRYSIVAPDTFTFSSTDLLEIDWDLNSRETETFDQTQVLTDTLGTITGVQGRNYIILDFIPQSIKYVHNSPSGTSLSFSWITGTPYIALPTPPTESVEVMYEYNGREPDPGNLYYMTVNVLRPSSLYNSPITTADRDSARRLLGPASPENDALTMAEIAFDNGTPQAIWVQVDDADSDGVFTKADYEAGIRATELDSLLTDVIVLNGFSSLSLQLSSNERMNDPFELKERMLWVGVPANTAIGAANQPNTLVFLSRKTMQVFGQNPAHGRRVLLGNTFATRTITLNDGSGLTVNLDGSFIAGASAALNASFNDPAEVLLRKNLTGFDTMQSYSESEMNQLGSASILYLSDQGAGVFRFEESVTVDTSAPENNEISAQNQIIFVTRDVRSRMDNSLISFVPPSQRAGVAVIQTTLVQILSELVGRTLIAGYDNPDGSTRPIDPSTDVEVFRSEDDKTLYNFRYWYNLRYGIKRLFGLFSVDKRLFGVGND